MSEDYLYRGFNCYINKEKALTPRNVDAPLETGAEFGDEHVQCGDSDFTFGCSVANTVHTHEYGGNGDPTSGLSTSPHFEVAKKYALNKGKYESGTVIKLSRKVLLDCGVQIFRVSDLVESPAVPEDDEYWIWFDGKFPENAILEEIRVERSS
ncbi:hypothetical protein C9J01_28555 [Photobacterium rosenbergii]|uniref:Uncharacterized protein n=1 Tax=Photobacterium rosenbergii TaxID=294936 RepID=A0A2T3MVZ4_9GAMM|nr:hypothetical protein [Photobacterium rosenbergii]PSW04110.1 hypothetical protein C9J01_28555 [Photobacterium rosenbergii]